MAGELLFHIGSAYAYLGQPEKALPFLEQARSNFNDKNIYIAEGLCYYRPGDFDRSEESLLTALKDVYPFAFTAVMACGYMFAYR